MDHPVRLIVAILVPGVLLGLGIWLNVAVVRRNRRYYGAHPERRPYGRRLALRASPFIGLGVVAGVYGFVSGDVSMALFGTVAAVLLSLEVVRRWQSPKER